MGGGVRGDGGVCGNADGVCGDIGVIFTSEGGSRVVSTNVRGMGASVFMGVGVEFELVASAASSDDGVNLVNLAPKAFRDSMSAVCVRKLSNFEL